MSDLNDLVNRLEKNNEILNEMEKECTTLPSDVDSWFYLLPHGRKELNSDHNKGNTNPVHVYVDFIEKDKKAKTPGLVNKSLSLVESTESQSQNSQIKSEMVFTSSQRNFSDLLVTDTHLVVNLCNLMGIRDLKNDELLELCSLFENNSDVSVQTGSLIFKEALFYKIKDFTMESKIPHSLRNCVKNLTVKHPSCVLEGVLKPCLIEKIIDVCHIEILSLIVGVLPENYLSPVLDCMSSTNLVGDSAIILLEVILKRSVNFSEENLTKIFYNMNLINEAVDDNIKFGKLLLSVLNVFKEQVTKSHLDLLTNIANNHKSFIKKPIMEKLNSMVKN